MQIHHTHIARIRAAELTKALDAHTLELFLFINAETALVLHDVPELRQDSLHPATSRGPSVVGAWCPLRLRHEHLHDVFARLPPRINHPAVSRALTTVIQPSQHCLNTAFRELNCDAQKGLGHTRKPGHDLLETGVEIHNILLQHQNELTIP